MPDSDHISVDRFVASRKQRDWHERRSCNEVLRRGYQRTVVDLDLGLDHDTDSGWESGLGRIHGRRVMRQTSVNDYENVLWRSVNDRSLWNWDGLESAA